MSSHADSTVATTVAYATLLSNINNRLIDLLKMLNGAGTDLPIDAIQLNRTTKKFERWTGTSWTDAVDIWDITVSAAKLLTQLKTVDGSLSGLDADLLDGKHSTDFVLATAYTAADVLAKLKTVDGDGSLLDADLLDGYHRTEIMPVGGILFHGATALPTGWLKCNGSAVSRTTYSELFSAIGTVFGAGDGATTFNVPDLRGEFVRGWDDARGVDSGRAFGTAQLDQMQRITGNTMSKVQHQSGAAGAAGALTYTAQSSGNSSGSSPAGQYFFDSGNSPNARVSADTSGETRPRNIALMGIIKYR